MPTRTTFLPTRPRPGLAVTRFPCPTLPLAYPRLVLSVPGRPVSASDNPVQLSICCQPTFLISLPAHQVLSDLVVALLRLPASARPGPLWRIFFVRLYPNTISNPFQSQDSPQRPSGAQKTYPVRRSYCDTDIMCSVQSPFVLFWVLCNP